MTKSFNVREPYLSYIKKGIKTIEGRLNKGKFADIKKDDIVLINDDFKVKIIGLNTYTTFKEMIMNEGIEKVIPNATSLDEAVNAYYKFYTKEQENEYGVIAIKMQLI
ncbi:MAG: hypothetical protein CO137_03825 [Candidatus Magasanikbacteria bacterium CG_4_9_14_3_um_filter_32_9]|uniref:ASCH domain-containing protein n=1 Tax=Candidatus Magasanikbacteria bacterium CG_4_9_14_3_um_filter_32_9 TaxID=1974644 RepID=A0A2M7Z5Y4_9BACT|nr:MAG: hypothetical protein CO137_03825 [Candidatus Magasanikbacteria bacterium CG_4_9_14_3_um_filter_32_9]